MNFNLGALKSPSKMTSSVQWSGNLGKTGEMHVKPGAVNNLVVDWSNGYLRISKGHLGSSGEFEKYQRQTPRHILLPIQVQNFRLEVQNSN